METKRTIIREFKNSDLNDMFEYCSQNEVGINAGWSKHKDIEETRKILEMFKNNFKNDIEYNFAIYHKSDNKVIGSICYRNTKLELLKDTEYENMNDKFVEIGFVLNKNYWNKGIMTEVASNFIQFIFNEIKADFITASYFNDNLASKKVQEKLGFKFLKYIKIKTRYGVLKDSSFNILKK